MADISEERQCGRDTRKKGRGRQGERRRGETGGGEAFHHDAHLDLATSGPAALRLLCGRRNGRRGARRTVLDGRGHASAEVSKSRVQDFVNDEWKGALEAVKAASLFSKWL